MPLPPRRVASIASTVALTAVLAATGACGAASPPSVQAGPADTAPSSSTPAPATPTTSIVGSPPAGGTTLILGPARPLTDPPAAPGAPGAGALNPARPGANLYQGITSANPVTAAHRFLVYVPHEADGTTMVIDPTTMSVIDTFRTGAESHHVVPSWDMSTLYVAASRGDLLTPIDPVTGKPGAGIPVEDPYNLYFLPDGSAAVVVEEGNQKLTFRDPKTFEHRATLQTTCNGINHLDFSADGSYLVASCEFEGTMVKVDLVNRTVVDEITLDMGMTGKQARNGHAQPQDVRLSPDGARFFVADLQGDGVWIIDGATFRVTGFLPTGVGAHGIYPNREGTKFFVINRGTNIVGGPPRGQGSVTVLDMATEKVETTWPIPGGGSPDMGNLTPDGTQLWLGGRYDNEVYALDTRTGALVGRVRVGSHPHGLTVWPQPGRYSMGHTGNMR